MHGIKCEYENLAQNKYILYSKNPIVPMYNQTIGYEFARKKFMLAKSTYLW